MKKIVVSREKVLELLKVELASMDEEIRNELYNVYYQPNEDNVWLECSGMSYHGDDEDAYTVAQIENQEVLFWKV